MAEDKGREKKTFMTESLDRAELVLQIEQFAERLLELGANEPLSKLYKEYMVRGDGSIVFRRLPPLPPKDQTTEKVSAAIKQWLSEDEKKNRGGGWV